MLQHNFAPVNHGNFSVRKNFQPFEIYLEARCCSNRKNAGSMTISPWIFCADNRGCSSTTTQIPIIRILNHTNMTTAKISPLGKPPNNQDLPNARVKCLPHQLKLGEFVAPSYDTQGFGLSLGVEMSQIQ